MLPKSESLPNGGKILAIKDFETGGNLLKCIIAFYDIANHPYVSWVMRTDDLSCHWGRYYSTYGEAFSVFMNRGVKPEMDKYNAIHIRNDKKQKNLIHIYGCILNESIELLNLNQLSSDYISELLTSHYIAEDAVNFGTMLSETYTLPMCSQLSK